MSPLTLELTLFSADVIRHVTLFTTRPRAYATITLLGGSSSRHVTSVDSHGGFRPTWNFPMKFDIDDSNLLKNSLMIVIQLRYRRRGPLGDKDIGLLYVPVRELYELSGGIHSCRHVALPVSSKAGKTKGVIYLSYIFFGREADVVPFSPPPPSAPPLPLELGISSAYQDRGSFGSSYPTTPYLDRGILVSSCSTTPYSGMYTPSAPCIDSLREVNSYYEGFAKVPYGV